MFLIPNYIKLYKPGGKSNMITSANLTYSKCKTTQYVEIDVNTSLDVIEGVHPAQITTTTTTH